MDELKEMLNDPSLPPAQRKLLESANGWDRTLRFGFLRVSVSKMFGAYSLAVTVRGANHGVEWHLRVR
jgi:hypothetical protein